MSKRNAAPTHSWVIGSQINKWLAGLFIGSLLIWGIAIWTVKYSLDRDCFDYYKRDLKVFGYWIKVQAGTLEDGCPEP